MTRVFVSHATADAAFAERFSKDLRAFGVDVWLDASHMGPGDFVSRISAALQRDVLILVLTPAAIESPWVQQEMNAAITRANQKLMRSPIVVLAAPCPLESIPALWTVYHRYDATQDYMPSLAAIVRELDLMPSGTPPPAAPQPLPSAAALVHRMPEGVETTGAGATSVPHRPDDRRTPQLSGVAASVEGTLTPAEGTTLSTRPAEDGAAHRHVGAYLALAGVAAVVALVALASFSYTQGLVESEFGLLAAIAVVMQSALVVALSIRSIASTSYQIHYVALVNVCEVALGLDALYWILLFTGHSWASVAWVFPSWGGFGIIALVLLAIVPALRMATPRHRWQSSAGVYSITIMSFGVFLLICHGHLPYRVTEVSSNPFGLSNIALALLGTVFASYVAIRQEQWTAAVWIIAAECIACLSLVFVLLPILGRGLPDVLLVLAPLLYGLFATQKRLP